MSTKLHTVNPSDALTEVRDIFEKNKVHHIPVVRYKKIVGIISKSDFLRFIHGYTQEPESKAEQATRLHTWTAQQIMTKGMAKVDNKDNIRTAIDVFLENYFHALPVVDNGELVGIVTTYDILSKIGSEPVTLEDYKTANTK
ncbi:MAG: CBS domain-containing protein [Saprospiraceae bacterium]